jgi:DNA-binding IclR family transcriptional regulator
MSAAQLANAMGVSRQSVHKTLGRMVGAGPLACVEGKYQIKAADDLSVPTGASDLI